MAPRPGADEPTLAFESTEAFEAWVAAAPADATGLWLKIAKKGSGIPTVTYAEAVEVGLCHGWIDGVKAAFDESWFLQRFTPRTSRSRWSKINCTKAEELIEAGRMRPAGMACIEAARADGRWDAAYAGARTAEVPPDLAAALEADPAAAAEFAVLDGNNRYAILHRIGEAKKPETRARRIEKFVAMLAAGETIHPRPASAQRARSTPAD